MSQINWKNITSLFDPDFQLAQQQTVAGGCINHCYQLRSQQNQHYFVKLNQPRYHSMFEAEALGLQALAASQTLHTPEVIYCDSNAEYSFLVLSYHPLSKRGDAYVFGQQLARLHQQVQPYFGFARDNFIGSSLQTNPRYQEWIPFWAEQRLQTQLELAAHNRLDPQLQRLGQQLISILPSFFEDYCVQPALLHGDLWSGNYGFDAAGKALIFDPACYYGDPECDLAMTELFGGFPATFYDGYHSIITRHPGYPLRRELYNLYHILNHANLFGESYSQQAKQMMLNLLDGRRPRAAKSG